MRIPGLNSPLHQQTTTRQKSNLNLILMNVIVLWGWCLEKEFEFVTFEDTVTYQN